MGGKLDWSLQPFGTATSRSCFDSDRIGGDPRERAGCAAFLQGLAAEELREESSTTVI